MMVKEYNKKLIEGTLKVSQRTLCKSMDIVERLTHPSKKIARIGSMIGGSAGIGLVILGTVGLLVGRSLWGVGSLIAGVSTIASNAVNMKKNK